MAAWRASGVHSSPVGTRAGSSDPLASPSVGSASIVKTCPAFIIIAVTSMNAQATQPKHISTYQRYSPKQSSKRHIPRATHADQEESKRDRIREMRIRQFACIINEHKKKIKLLESSQGQEKHKKERGLTIQIDDDLALTPKAEEKERNDAGQLSPADALSNMLHRQSPLGDKIQDNDREKQAEYLKSKEYRKYLQELTENMNPTDLVHRMKQARNHNLYINPKKTKMHTEEQSDKIQTIKKQKRTVLDQSPLEEEHQSKSVHGTLHIISKPYIDQESLVITKPCSCGITPSEPVVETVSVKQDQNITCEFNLVESQISFEPKKEPIMLPLRTNLDGWNGVIYADYKIDRPKFGVKGNHYPSPRRDYCEVNHKVTTQYQFLPLRQSHNKMQDKHTDKQNKPLESVTRKHSRGQSREKSVSVQKLIRCFPKESGLTVSRPMSSVRSKKYLHLVTLQLRG